MNFGDGKINLIIKLGVSGIVGIIVYFGMLFIMRTGELTKILRRDKK